MKKFRKFKDGDLIRYLGDKKRRRWTTLKNKEITGKVIGYGGDATVVWRSGEHAIDMVFGGKTNIHFSPEHLLEKISDVDPSEEL